MKQLLAALFCLIVVAALGSAATAEEAAPESSPAAWIEMR